MQSVNKFGVIVGYLNNLPPNKILKSRLARLTVIYLINFRLLMFLTVVRSTKYKNIRQKVE